VNEGSIPGRLNRCALNNTARTARDLLPHVVEA